jgi:hypothetical protein
VATRARRSTRSRASAEPDEDRLVRDYSKEEYREPGEGYNGPQPTKGLYPAKLVIVNNHTKQGEDEPSSIRWGFELTDGTAPDEDGEPQSVAGFRDYQYTNDDTTLWREQQIAVALGLIKPKGKLSMTFKQILAKAKPCTVRIVRERYIPPDDPDAAEWRAKIASVMVARDLGKKGATSTRRRKIEDEEPEPDDVEETEEEEGDDEWPEDPDELAEALEELSLAELKKVARDDFEVKVTRGMDAEDIVEAILDTLEEDEEPEEEEPEEDPEPEPEPPKRRSRASTGSRSGKTGSARGRRARGGSTEDPPF